MSHDESTDQDTEQAQKEAPAPEDMAKQMGVAVEELGKAMVEKMQSMQREMEEMHRRMAPPKPNRAQRRAMKRGGRKIPNNAVRGRK